LQQCLHLVSVVKIYDPKTIESFISSVRSDEWKLERCSSLIMQQNLWFTPSQNIT